MKTIIILVAYVILKTLIFICKVFDYFDFTSRGIEWKKWLLGVPAAIVVAFAMLFFMILAVQGNNNFGIIDTVSGIINVIREMCNAGIFGNLIDRIVRIATALFAFKVFALCLPPVTEWLVRVYRYAMRNVRL